MTNLQPSVDENSKHPLAEQQQAFYLPADKERKLVFDNLDFKQQVHNMTEQHKNIDVHWVTHLSVENCVSWNHLSSEKPDAGNLLSQHEHHMPRENFIALTERAFVEIPWSTFLKPVVCKHIPHQYSKYTREKSEMVRYL